MSSVASRHQLEDLLEESGEGEDYLSGKSLVISNFGLFSRFLPSREFAKQSCSKIVQTPFGM